MISLLQFVRILLLNWKRNQTNRRPLTVQWTNQKRNTRNAGKGTWLASERYWNPYTNVKVCSTKVTFSNLKNHWRILSNLYSANFVKRLLSRLVWKPSFFFSFSPIVCHREFTYHYWRIRKRNINLWRLWTCLGNFTVRFVGSDCLCRYENRLLAADIFSKGVKLSQSLLV